MGKYGFEVVEQGDKLTISFHGMMDVDVALPTVDTAKVKSIIFDFDKLDGINSCGIREWVVWLREMPQELAVSYVNCPRVLVEQFNMIKGIIKAENSTIESFYVPYYCDDCDDEVRVLHSGKEACNPSKDVKCEECGATAELDILEAKYLKFFQIYCKV